MKVTLQLIHTHPSLITRVKSLVWLDIDNIAIKNHCASEILNHAMFIVALNDSNLIKKHVINAGKFKP